MRAEKADRPDGRLPYLLIAWVALIALDIYQMPAFTGSAQAMPLSPSSVVEDVAAPCAAMDQAAGQDRAGTSATPDSRMPCCATTTPGVNGDEVRSIRIPGANAAPSSADVLLPHEGY